MERARLTRAIAIAILVTSFAVAFALTPGLPPICPSRLFLHVPCPTCGMTRAFGLALRGNWMRATRMHPLVWVVVPTLAYAAFAELRAYVTTGRWGVAVAKPAAAKIAVALAIALVVVWAARIGGALGGPVPS